MASTAVSGTIKTIKADRGYGFIKPNGGGDDVFFHVATLQGLPFDESLIERDVMFTTTDSDRGPKAARVWTIN